MKYIKTKQGVFILQTVNNSNYYTCPTDEGLLTVYEDSPFWKNNVIKISYNLFQLADNIVISQPSKKPRVINKDLMAFDKWNSFIQNIKENNFHYYLSMWDENINLKKFAELTDSGFKYINKE